ncbi:MAG TPA: hypothetical protein VI504_13650 [Candidatus Eisenbacteria bacterium]
MRRVLAGLVALLWFCPAPARAGGVNLRWGECFGDGGAPNGAFACDDNSTPHPLVTSFVLDQPVPAVTRVTSTIQIASEGATLPAWWEFAGTTACRTGALVPTSTLSIPSVVCVDWAKFHGSTGVVAYVIGERGANTARLVIAGALFSSPGGNNLAAGPEYIAVAVTINSVRTVATPSCGGCTTGVCLVLDRVELTSGSLGSPVVLRGPAGGPDAGFVTWQGGGNVGVGAQFGCPAATRVRHSAWGAIKTLYR